jgi:glycosyltransferase involved in cell wall biosynthesis
MLERLADRSDVIVDVFHGPSKTGSGAPAEPPDLRNIGLRVSALEGIEWPFGRRPIAWMSGTWRILAGDYDVIICQETVNNFSVWVFSLMRRVFRKRLILHGWGYRPAAADHGPIARVRHAARWLLLSMADAVITYTDRGRLSCIELGVSPERIFVSGNTLDVERLAAFESEVSTDEVQALRNPSEPDDGIVLLFVGRIQHAKRIDILIHAVKRIRQGGRACRLYVIGDGPERQRLEDLAGGSDDIDFLGAMYDERALVPYFLASDLLVIPGRVGLTCVHAFSHGLPVITTTETIIPQTPEYDYVIDGKNGVIVNELTPERYADIITELTRNRSVLSDLQAGARDTAARLTMARMVESFVGAVNFARSR